MKKASKILTLILVFVLLAGVFSGCAMFTRNTGKYRSLVAVTVGEQEITVGKILDSFNNYYNTYGAYIGQGITVDWLMQMTMQSLVTQAMKVDSYVSGATAETHIYKDICDNAQYLTQEEIEYCIKYIKYITFQSFDSSVQSLLAADRTIADEKAEDTSRDFTEPDKLEAATYSEHTYRSRVFSEDADEYFEEHYNGITITLNLDIAEYVYASESAAKATIDGLNDRLDKKDAKITYEEYKQAQEKIVNQYKRSINNTYNIDFEQFMRNQVQDMVTSVIVTKYDWNVNKTIDVANLQATLDRLNNNLKLNSDAQTAGFALNDNFVDFIEGLSATSYIYNVPEKYQRVKNGAEQSGYIFVKNILVPFAATQTTKLSNIAKELGGNTEHPKYIELRNKFAAEVVAKDFNNPVEGEEGKYEEVRNLFMLNGNNELIVNPEGELGEVFGELNAKGFGTVTGGADAVVDAMKRFNTDTAQHTAAYEYVVRVGETPSDYTAKWVTEFVDAANKAAKGEVGNAYALAISTYGVHIVFYSADVEAQSFNFAENYLDTTKPEYKLFNSYFSQQSTILLNENVKELTKSYLDSSKIKTNKNFDRFLKDNSFKFNLIEFLTDDKD